jgi:hypothetical protein
LCWNLVDGVHDGPEGSERRIWTNGSASEVGAASFTATLDRVTFPNGSLDFTSEAVRARRDRLGIISSDYVQPFGTFTGRFGDTTLERGFGVMEHHRAKW